MVRHVKLKRRFKRCDRICGIMVFRLSGVFFQTKCLWGRAENGMQAEWETRSTLFYNLRDSMVGEIITSLAMKSFNTAKDSAHTLNLCEVLHSSVGLDI